MYVRTSVVLPILTFILLLIVLHFTQILIRALGSSDAVQADTLQHRMTPAVLQYEPRQLTGRDSMTPCRE